jgi:predicted transcriptional regulator
MQQNNNGTIELIRVLNNSVLTLGVKKVITYLKWVTKMNGSDRKDVADLVIYSVCEKFKIPPNALLESERTDGAYNDAMCLIAVLLKKHALMSQNEIATKLKRHKSQISKYITRMSQLNIELFKSDKKLYSDYTEINDSIEKLIQKEQQTWMSQSVKNNEEDHEKIS